MPESGQILGIEGTAWNLSAALFGEDVISLFSRPYSPPSGGIHPREASQHHASAMKEVIEKALLGQDIHKIKGIAFSRGPGLGPCLRTVGTAARSLALALDVPLIGVNHCVAHVEIGRWQCGCDDPVVLYASGANTQVLGFLKSRYRIFGETLDIGLGNCLDKFARSKGMPHPGGPLIEKLASEGDPVELPYTVKGMDLAFSGIMSAAKDCKAPLEDVCAGFQETAFAMCVEVTERALAHSGKDEVLLVGGVGANSRLREMLGEMCDERGATFYVPEKKYIGDNGAMIALTGKIMLEAGQTIPVFDSAVNPGYRSDDVEVFWRNDTGDLPYARANLIENGQARGAEAVVTTLGDNVVKKRLSKRYRNPSLDKRLIAERTRAEARLISMARRCGVPTPIVRDVTADSLVMENISGNMLKLELTCGNVLAAGEMVGRLHCGGIIHGDLTTSNIIVREGSGQCVLIDFGLSYISSEIESRGVDVHVFFQTLESTAPDHGKLRDSFCEGYRNTFECADQVLERVEEIRARGRYLH
ncbi:bifunctional N(6)-L-threonylcarbamoyladenine synthase/serine/threonine protein kinase [Methanoplanus sp. FWC-SCC4]|uniref:Probable bifunctional tRNA threonylcarbamoyladenosine biosynthesis protein n=1 Tax=Methanochimaera problematica TaxID=2609417 RepID=A0AA97FGM3_9EURY|nr:bifunctional N(6)-L-threonylcarbamoyladenine synthase/serine/threonine protein kinase [Methanoplanus sp. FWC-SCC4]WOF17076.1 bifunctional N(6)-L-threonylcarbamoyladenine synthase/serine/threonine protein kinase [Methanoplanus sp. FWC-SCC4]